MKEIEIQFDVHGTVIQTIEVPDDMTAEQVVRQLEDGMIATTLQEGRSLLLLTDLETEVGKIINVDAEVEFSGFEVHNDEPESEHDEDGDTANG